MFPLTLSGTVGSEGRSLVAVPDIECRLAEALRNLGAVPIIAEIGNVTFSNPMVPMWTWSLLAMVTQGSFAWRRVQTSPSSTRRRSCRK